MLRFKKIAPRTNPFDKLKPQVGLRRWEKNIDASKSMTRFTVLLLALFIAGWLNFWLNEVLT